MNWKIDEVWGDYFSGKVTRIDITATSTEGEYTASESRSAWCHETEVDYEGLTEEAALDLVKTSIDEQEWKMLAYQLDTMINEMKNPNYLIGIPWKQS